MNKTQLAKKAHQRAKRRGETTLKETDYYNVLTDIVTRPCASAGIHLALQQ